MFLYHGSDVSKNEFWGGWVNTQLVFITTMLYSVNLDMSSSTLQYEV